MNYFNTIMVSHKLLFKMNTKNDFESLPENNPSLCIPRVCINWSESQIRSVLDSIGLGEIKHINILTKGNFKLVFIHFKRWFSNDNANMARERLLNGKDIKIIYEDPWFWKISVYRELKKKDNINNKIVKHRNFNKP